MAGRILITHGTRPFAQRVGQLLQDRYTVQFGSSEAMPQVLVETGNYLVLPGAGTPAFEHELLKACLDNRIDVLLPLGEREIQLLSRAQQLFAEYGIDIRVPDAVDSGAMNLIRNPERRFPLRILDQGVFTQLAPTSELALCCIAD